MLEPSEVTESTYLCNALVSLINVVPEPAGANCGSGGQAIQTGQDTNGNGILESGEIQHTSYVCSPGCPGGFHDDGTGICAQSGCASGYHDDGTGKCVQSGCAASYHDGGNGTCVAIDICATGYQDSGDGICQVCAGGACLPGCSIGGARYSADIVNPANVCQACKPDVAMTLWTAITTCLSGDGCCPAGCTANTDSDCSPTCGNGVVEAGETCDPPSSCPTICSADNACTTAQLIGSASSCNAICSHTAITTCLSGDGCCPANCTANTDSDCPATARPAIAYNMLVSTSGTSCGYEQQVIESPSAFLVGGFSPYGATGFRDCRGNPAIDEHRAALLFDLADLSGKTVVSAKLRMSAESTRSDVVISGQAFKAAWNPSTLTFANQPPTLANLEVLQGAPVTVGSWEMDVTPIVGQWVSGAMPNYGLVLTAPVNMWTDSYTVFGGIPELAVTYQ
jgi:hypothetical protein